MQKMTSRLKAIAYRKGVDAAKIQKGCKLPPCPYDETKKRELSMWFWAGFRDHGNKMVDLTMYEAGEQK